MEDLKSILESLLFVAGEPLTLDRFKKVLPLAETKDIKDALTALMDEYDQKNGGFFLMEVAGGFQFRTRPQHKEWIQRLIERTPFRLSKAALETLAIIAYKQPLIRSDIEHIRGVDSGGVLRMLLEKKIIRVLGRKEIPGRPMIYATTKKFLEIFGLMGLKDLPSISEIEEFAQKSIDTLFDEESPENIDNGPIELEDAQISIVDIKDKNDVPDGTSEPNSIENQIKNDLEDKETQNNSVIMNDKMEGDPDNINMSLGNLTSNRENDENHRGDDIDFHENISKNSDKESILPEEIDILASENEKTTKKNIAPEKNNYVDENANKKHESNAITTPKKISKNSLEG